MDRLLRSLFFGFFVWQPICDACPTCIGFPQENEPPFLGYESNLDPLNTVQEKQAFRETMCDEKDLLGEKNDASES